MTGVRSLAAAQTIPKRGDVEANVEEHLRLARAAGKEGARVLVFPELSLTGYELDLAAELAFAEDDARLAPLVEAAAASRMTLVVGAPVRVGTRLHIGAFILSPEGTVDLYTKQHLGAFPAEASPDGIVPPAEKTVFAPGDRNPLVRFDGHTAAVAVCADTGQPTHPAEAAERGAKTYLAGVFFTPGYREEAAQLGDYAVRHAMAVVMANFGGPTGGLDAGGASAIWSETGELLVQLEGTGSGIALAVESENGWSARAVRPNV